MITDEPDSVCDGVIIGNNHSTFTGVNMFMNVEAINADIPKRPRRTGHRISTLVLGHNPQ